MAQHFISDSKAPLRTIKSIKFGILSPDEIEASVAEIEHGESMENKMPKAGGLSDVRLGCIERNMKCSTCGENINNCPGHFGHIKLAEPVYHIGFLKIVKKILECVCFKCARFRILETDYRYKKLLKCKDKFKYAWDNAKGKIVCEYPDCEAQLLPLRKAGVQLFFDPKKIDKKMSRKFLSAKDARDILERISDDTCKLIGLDAFAARPEWMIISSLPVPPPCVRPSVSMDGNGKGEDDLTYMLTNIIKNNNQILHSSGRSAADYKELLQFNVTTYMDNDVSGIPQALQKGGRPVKALKARLAGKEGRMRGNLMGKRVDYSARTVITGDPHISIDEVGVPRSIAANLSFPEAVTDFNIAKLQQLVDNSPNYPGAKYVIKKSGVRIDLHLASKKPYLDIGDVVERHVITGDTVLFNRQPSLHKMSMMAHTVKVMDFSTFRMNVNICAGYNADFDGGKFFPFLSITMGTTANFCFLFFL